MKNKTAKYLPLLFLFLFSIAGLVFNFGAFDRVATQWLYISVINIISITYLFNTKVYSEKWFLQLYNYKPILFFSIFILFGLISLSYAENPTEVILKTVRFLVVITTIIALIGLSQKVEDPFLSISIIFTIVAVIEMYYSYSPYYQITTLTDYSFEFANILKGATGNKNVTAAALLIKLPFVIYLVGRISKNYLKVILSIIIVLITFMVFLLSARAALLSLSILFIILVIYIFTNFYNTKNRLLLTNRLLFVALPILISFFIFQINYGEQNSASITNRIGTINTENESVNERLRFYKYSFEQLVNSPLIGVGLGNWKTKSVAYDKQNIEGYVIPYHVHNDFLEFGVELGVLGLILYLAIFMLIFLHQLKVFRSDLNSSEFFSKSALILSVLLIYLVDANLNFPHARVVMQIPFAVLLTLSFLTTKKLKA